MTIKDFALPDLGEGLTESEIVAWHVAEGDVVTLNQVIADVETAKAMVELPSPHAGTVRRLHVPAGTTVDVGQTIVSFEVDGGDAAAPTGSTPTETAPTETAPTETAATETAATEQPAEPAGNDDGPDDGPDVAPPNLVGYGAGAEATGRPARRERNFAAEGEPEPTVASTPTAVTAKAAPPVRALASQLGVDLTSVHGTGDGGVITRADIEALLTRAPERPLAPGESGTATPVTGIRKLTAEAVTHSAFTAPHVTVFLTVDVTRTVELLDELRGTAAFRDVRLTFLAVVAKAVSSSIARTPDVNSRWDDSDNTITRFAALGLGIAAATPRGLIVPVIHDAHALDLAGLASALTALTATAKSGQTRPADLTGGTFTITNVGVFGVDAGTPIINNGEAAILAVGAVSRRPWEWQGEVALRQIVTLSLSFDHRVLDGEQGSRFLADVGRLLANPASAFAL